MESIRPQPSDGRRRTPAP